jgi:hypothetical protein
VCNMGLLNYSTGLGPGLAWLGLATSETSHPSLLSLFLPRPDLHHGDRFSRLFFFPSLPFHLSPVFLTLFQTSLPQPTPSWQLWSPRAPRTQRNRMSTPINLFWVLSLGNEGEKEVGVHPNFNRNITYRAPILELNPSIPSLFFGVSTGVRTQVLSFVGRCSST